MTPNRDRRAALAGQTDRNGIDFVEIRDRAETRLRVHFLVAAPDQHALRAAITGATITGGATIPSVPVRWNLTQWGEAAGRPWVELAVDAPGDFSTYTLAFAATRPVLDPYLDRAAFSFKANCPSTIDCEATPHGASSAAAATDPVPIDYLAKDFDSFKQALLAFSALRYPAWQERSEADFGVMFAEALASLADDLSYLQDRIAGEGWLETATERRSLVRLARLVDYEPRVATAARTWLALTIDPPWAGDVPAGLVAGALAPDATRIDFELGTGLDGPTAYRVAAAWNPRAAYWWDDAERVLPAGATAMWIEAPDLPLLPGRWILIDTAPELAGERPVRQVVQLVAVETPVADPLFGIRVVRITWRDADALRADHDLARTTVTGNVIPATHGRRATDRFTAAPGGAIVRTGANGTRQYLHTLRHAPLAWLAPDDPDEAPRPELRVTETTTGDAAGGASVQVSGRPGLPSGAGGDRVWGWKRSLLDPPAQRHAFTVDPMRYVAIDSGHGAGRGLADYDGADGDTIRFGDGVFGGIPADGAAFTVVYRVGGGTRGNVAADTITRLDAPAALAAVITAVTNPLPAEGGRDAEPDDRVRELAPHQFRAAPLRAVRTEDYERAATSRPWVQRAGTTFRSTGSWLAAFTSVDPRGTDTLPVARRIELTRLLDRRRLAGYQAFVLPPRYASLDVEITACARPDAFRGDVEAAIRAVAAALFHPDRFTFGVALERSVIAAAIQDAPGVDGVVALRYRRRGHTADFVAMPTAITVGRSEIVRVDNDPARPDAGSVRVVVLGGK